MSRRPLSLLRVQRVEMLACAEDQGDTPDARKRDDRIDDAAQERGLTTADPCDEVEAEQPDAAPVQCADHGNDERDSIHNHFIKALRH